MTIRGGPPLSNTRTSLPQIQSKFDLEPNPFEQSFKDSPAEPIQPPQPNTTTSPSLDHLLNRSQPRKARSSSPSTHFSSENRLSPPVIRQTPGGSLVKVSLPGINSIASPAILLHHTGTSTPKSLSPPSLSHSQSVQSSIPGSMPSYNWNFGALGDSLRAGPLSPALLNGPAPVRSTSNPVTHTGLTPLLDIDNNNANGTITPGTQALIAILSGNGQDSSDIRNPVAHPPLPLPGVVPSSTSADSNSHNEANHQPTPDSAKLSGASTGSSSSLKPQPLHSAIQRPSGSSNLHPIDSTPKPTSSSSLQDRSQESTSTNRSSPSPQTHEQNTASSSLARSRLDPVSVVSGKDPTTSPPSSSTHYKRGSSSNSCVQSSMAASIGPSGVSSLHSVSPLGLSQTAISTTGPYSCTTGRSSFPQPTMPLSIPSVPPFQSTAEIVTPLSPSSTPRNTMNPLPPVSGDRTNDQFNTNPLYLLTVAHEASSRMSQYPISNRDPLHHDSMDDATATAAAALTGLGSSGGSRYSSPGPAMIPNGTLNPHLINNIQNTQSAILKHVDDGSSAASPRLSSQRPNPLPDSSSIPPGVVLCPETGVNLLSAHHDSPFSNEASSGVHGLNGLLPQASSSSSGSAVPMSFSTNYPNQHLGPMIPMSMPDSSSGQQLFSSFDLSATKKKGKKRKDTSQAAFEDHHQPNNINSQDGAQASHLNGEPQSSPSAGNSSAPRGGSKAPRIGKPLRKAKKMKKSKPDESGDDSDSRDGYWGTEEDKGFMKHKEDGEFDGYAGNAQMSSNYDPDHIPPAAQPSSSGKPETEEEKRKNFLERNRQAALKCRQRKKAWLANLQTKVEYLSTENETLQMTINSLREEIDSFRSILVSHKDCPITVGGGRGATTTIGELVGREPGLLAASAAAILAQQQHHHTDRAALRHLQQAPVNAIHGSTQVTASLTSSNATIVQSHHNPHGTVTSSYGY
ncbi:hypothetical protein PCASD_23420 [Puccinia coronata f. sp. avenae]|uniref:BZIP domain-containing protein n=1 Tax=Puccinia coronata f. sp. avenae TaxID=200324 RepID=A0A2N5TMQ0_9BASI|nr:hypothetical protein PCASD_23420 [Puccinia coronata f. sp. avenae]